MILVKPGNSRNTEEGILGYMCFSTVVLMLSAASVVFGQTNPAHMIPSTPSTTLPSLPSTPLGRSTVIGGRLEKVDPVQDQLRLKVSGADEITISFDERTQVYQDGTKVSILHLHPADHASIETALDGTALFAVQIHLLTDPAHGQIHGQVISYEPRFGDLKLRVNGSSEAVMLSVPDTVAVTRVGQEVFTSPENAGLAAIVRGSLVNVTFRSDKKGRGVATHIDIIAFPGAVFTFIGKLTSIDLPTGRMSIADASDRPVDISFDASRFPMSRDWHQNSLMRVTARFDGYRYIATEITPK